MIIRELYLEHFGQFHNKKIELSEGINLLYGENEAGKTTIHTFIRGMLFGLERSRGKGAKQDTYSKYEPWDMPGSYSGSMVFEIGDATYRMKREFRTDRKAVEVIRMNDGKILTPEEQKGLFGGLFEESYYNTVSVSQLGGQTDGDLGVVLKQYAANLASTKHAEMNLKKASEFLNEKKKQLRKENQVDKKAIFKSSWLDLDEKERQFETARKSQEEKLKEQAEEIKSIQEDYLKELAEEQKEKDALKQMQTECKALCDRQLALAREQKDLQVKIGEKREQIGRIMQKLEEAGLTSLDDVLVQKEKEEKKLKISVWSLLGTLGALAMVGVSLYFFLVADMIVEGLLSAAIAVSWIIICVWATRNKIKASKKRIDELDTYKDLCVRYAATQSEFEQLRRVSEESDKKAATINQSIRTMEDDIQKKLSGMPEKAKETAKILAEQHQKERQLQWELEAHLKTREQLDDERSEIKEQLERIGSAEIEIRALELAGERLSQVAVKIRESFGAYLNDRASFYIDKITGGKYNKLVIDDAMQIYIHTADRVLTVNQMSKGTMEQIYLSLRLAAADIIFEEDHKPILLDDAFVAYDNKRMAMTLASLSETVEQAVIFSCHTREKAVLDMNQVPYHYVRL